MAESTASVCELPEAQALGGVAFSGGRDSVALLHASATAARGTGLRVVALHVHHGLMPQADQWVDHMQLQVAQWQAQGLPVAFSHVRLRGSPAAGDSVEAWARKHRYQALTAMAKAQGIGTVLLAQHLKDQAETVMLQALRGAGPAGWAAMPRAVLREEVWWIRPWLNQPRRAIEAYISVHGLS